jgi:hypothetical protein
MNEKDLEKYSYLWDGSDPDWVLLRAPEVAGGLCVYNKNGRALLLVESSDLNMALCEELKRNGVEILENPLPGQAVVKPRN